jgi:hypothetical protein
VLWLLVSGREGAAVMDERKAVSSLIDNGTEVHHCQGFRFPILKGISATQFFYTVRHPLAIGDICSVNLPLIIERLHLHI